MDETLTAMLPNQKNECKKCIYFYLNKTTNEVFRRWKILKSLIKKAQKANTISLLQYHVSMSPN